MRLEFSGHLLKRLLTETLPRLNSVRRSGGVIAASSFARARSRAAVAASALSSALNRAPSPSAATAATAAGRLLRFECGGKRLCATLRAAQRRHTACRSACASASGSGSGCLIMLC